MQKTHPADAGLRFGLMGFVDSDISGILESMVLVELLRCGYTVYAGQTGSYVIYLSLKNGHLLIKNGQLWQKLSKEHPVKTMKIRAVKYMVYFLK